MRLILALLLLASLPGCAKPDGAAGTRAAPATACTKEGQQCVYSEGKIGLCNATGATCDGAPCLTCMSLH